MELGHALPRALETSTRVWFGSDWVKCCLCREAVQVWAVGPAIAGATLEWHVMHRVVMAVSGRG